jgi:hypothetical protein
MAAWPIKFTEGSKSGKKHPLHVPIDLSTENKKDPLKFCSLGPTGPTISCISVSVTDIEIYG